MTQGEQHSLHPRLAGRLWRSHGSSAPGRCSGQSLAELAIMLPIWMVLVVGLIDMSRVYANYVAIQNAAREGARYGANNPTDTSGIIAHANREVAPSGVVLTSVQVSCPSGSCSHNNPIRVTVRLDFPLITGYIFGTKLIPLQTSVDFLVV